MQLDKDALQKLLSLDDKTFQNKVKQAIQTSGIKNDKLDKITNDPTVVKKMLSNMTEADIKKFSAFVGSGTMEELLKNLQNNINK